MLSSDDGSLHFWGKIVLTKFISGCRMVWDLICGTSWFNKSKTESYKRRKVCHSAQLMLSSSYNSALYTPVEKAWSWRIEIQYLMRLPMLWNVPKIVVCRISYFVLIGFGFSLVGYLILFRFILFFLLSISFSSISSVLFFLIIICTK